MLTKRLTVIVIHYNRPTLLRRALDSVEAQTCRSQIDVIVCDDHSDEVPWDALSGYTVIRGPRLTPEEKQRDRCTLGWLINRALALVETEFVAYLTDDCQWTPDHLERLVAMLDADPGAVAACSRWRLVGDPAANRGREPSPYPRARMDSFEIDLLLQGRNLIDHNVLMHRTAHHGERIVPAWPEEPRYWPHADWPAWRSLAARTDPAALWLFDHAITVNLYNDATHLGASALRGESVAQSIRNRPDTP